MKALKARLAYTVMEEKDPEKALGDLLALYSDPYESAAAICSTIANTRRLITRQERYRHPEYEAKLVALMSTMDKWSEDHQRLERLLCAPLAKQQGVFMSRAKYLESPEADEALKQLRPVQDPVYDFVAPGPIMRAARVQREARIMGQQYHTNRERSFYRFSITEAEQYLSTARSVLRCPVDSPSAYYELVASLGILTGRRNYEIMVTLGMYPGPTVLQASVVGICKKAFGRERYETPCCIPLLAPYDDVWNALEKLRAYRSYEVNDDCTVVSGHSSKGISRACKRLFGRVLTHTQKRNIYSEMAYRDKENNGFRTGANSCSKNAWIAAALVHVPSFRGHTCRYQAMTVTDE